MVRLVVLALVVGCGTEISVVGEPSEGDHESVEFRYTWVDEWEQVTVFASDVLFVVDHSCSMAHEQRALGDSFDVFFERMLASGNDFHIGVVSMDMDDPSHSGRLRDSGPYRWIDEETEAPLDHFRSMVNLGTGGSFTEKGRSATFAALDTLSETYNQGFLRQPAELHIVVVTDENDVSGNQLMTRGEFSEYLVDLKLDPFRTTFSSVVGLLDEPAPGSFECIAEHGSEYLAITDIVGGLKLSICAEEWGSVLGKLGLLASGLRTEFYLTQKPRDGTLQVEVEQDGVVLDPEAEGIHWTYTLHENKITFVDYLPPEGVIVRAEYRPARN
ncbi:MAG: hypothetical protein AAGA48_38980 [Myxococcota bacterium]